VYLRNALFFYISIELGWQHTHSVEHEIGHVRVAIRGWGTVPPLAMASNVEYLTQSLKNSTTKSLKLYGLVQAPAMDYGIVQVIQLKYHYRNPTSWV